MSIIDDMKDKAQDVMNDDEKRAQIEKMAKDKGISIDEAKSHFTQHDK